MASAEVMHAAQQIAAMRPHQRAVKERGSAAWRQIEALHEQRAQIADVRMQLPGGATNDDAIAWLDANCPAWRSGPAPRGTVYQREEEGDDAE